MAGRKRASGISRFAAVWILIAVIVTIIWAGFMVFITVALEEYEAVQEYYVADLIFDRYFKKADPADIVKYSTSPVSSFEEGSDAAEYFSGILASGELTYNEVISADPSVKLYAVSAGDVTFASFSVGEGAETTDVLKLHYPELKSISVNVKPLEGVVVYAPLLAEVRVNGVALDGGFVEGDMVVLDEEPYFPDDDDDFRVFVNYMVADLYLEPKVEVSFPGLGEIALERDPDTGVYSAERDYIDRLAERYNASVLRSEKLRELADERRRLAEEERLRLEEEERQRISDGIKATYGTFIRDMARQYNRFIYSKTWLAGLRENTLVYFKRYTDIYNYVNGGYYNWADFVMKTIEFSDEDSMNYVWLDEAHTKFKCRVTATVYMTGTTLGAAADDTERFDMVAYVETGGAKPLVYALVATETDMAESAQ